MNYFFVAISLDCLFLFDIDMGDRIFQEDALVPIENHITCNGEHSAILMNLFQLLPNYFLFRLSLMIVVEFLRQWLTAHYIYNIYNSLFET